MAVYDYSRIEKEWQKKWEQTELYKAESASTKPKFYALDMFPYPSGAGLHVGHPLGYIASDIYSRFKRLNGFNVLHPMGFDAFGLPAEQYAIQTGKHPSKTTEENIHTYKRQLNNIGLSFDWSREVNTSDPNYYKWTQWIFTKMFNHYYCKKENKAKPIDSLINEFKENGNINSPAFTPFEETFTAIEWNSYNKVKQADTIMNYRLAFRKTSFVNWCEELGTVLANDEVVNGVSERGGFPVTQKPLLQWSLRITAYAERLLQGLKGLDWSDSLKTQQENWIGKSVGASVKFEIAGLSNIGSKPSSLAPNPSPSPKMGEGDKEPQWQTADSNTYKHTKEFQKENRKNPTNAESLLWDKLKTKQLGFKFRRQHIIDIFIPDFVCLEKMIIVEVDGRIHDLKENKEKDKARTIELEKLGFKVIRFSNDEVENNIEAVVKTIQEALKNAQSKENPLPPSGEGPRLGVQHIEVFTTRPDTIYGVTFMVLAPEHPLVNNLTTSENQKEVVAYQEKVKGKSSIDRQAGKEVSGVFTGSYAIHPFSKKEIPIWVSDYVLIDYGTGAIMAVPSDDDRDKAFANKMNLEIIEICDKTNFPNATAADKVGIMQNSDFLNGMKVKEAIKASITKIHNEELGNAKTNYKLKDANFSRQRYWGEPFPIFYTEDGIAHTLPNENLPLELPPMDDIKPENGKAPLSKVEDWKHQGHPLDTDTMPGNAGSSWYFLRYMDPHNDNEFCSSEALKYWQDVDLYIGGTEHAVGHLMYARFWHKFLFDLGYLPTEEPFKKLLNQGMIQGMSAFVSVNMDTKELISSDLNTEDSNIAQIHADISLLNSENTIDIEAFKNWRPDFKSFTVIDNQGNFSVKREVEKMSKSKFNVVNPDEVIAEYGTDCFRMFEMFLGPIETAKPWNTKGIDGVAKFIRKFWNLFYKEDVLAISQDEATKEELKVLHTCIKKVTEDIERFSFNTCISAFMICVNDLNDLNCNKSSILKPLLVLMAPFAPHITEEIWSKLGMKASVHKADWPLHDEKFLVESSKKYPVSINGKMRTTLEFALDAPKDLMEKEILSNEIVIKWMEGKPLKKLIIIPGKIINVVV